MCIQYGRALVVWFGRTDHHLVLRWSLSALGHRPSIAIVSAIVECGMVDVVLRTSTSPRYQTLAGSYHPYASSDPGSGTFQ